jgi:hypothetical protein
MGELRAGLRKLGVADNTVLWYCSDNGGLKPNSMGGLAGKKGSLLEGGIRVPSLIEWPAVIRKGRRSSMPSNTVDMYPTVLELAGVRLREEQPVLDGVSLVDHLKGELFHRDKAMGFWDFPASGRGRWARRMLEALRKEQQAGEQQPAPKEGLIEKQYPLDEFPGPAAWIDGDWKLHRIPDKKGPGVQYRLHFLRKDLKEQRDLAGVQPERLARMKAELAAWQKSVLASLNGGDYPK